MILKQYSKDLIHEIDKLLGNYKLDNKHCKEYFGGENTIRWFFIYLLILMQIGVIVMDLYQIFIILTIDDDNIDGIVNKLKEKDSFMADMLMGEEYISLKCHKKRMCCIFATLLRLFQSVITIIFYYYIGVKCRVIYGLIFSMILYTIIGIMIYFMKDDKTAETVLCPMPHDYRKLFSFWDEENIPEIVQNDKLKYLDKDNGYNKQF